MTVYDVNYSILALGLRLMHLNLPGQQDPQLNTLNSLWLDSR